MTTEDTIIRAACSDLIAAFAAHVDNRNFAEAVALFAPDGVFERPDLTARGHAEIAGLWADRPESHKTRHLCHLTWFSEVGENLVRAVTPFTLYQAQHHGEGFPPVPARVAIAEFHDEFTFVGSAWRIAHRRSVPAMFG